MSFDELDFFDNESDNDESGSGSPGTCIFPFCSVESVGSAGESVGSFSGVGSGNFVPTEIKSLGDVFTFVMFAPIGVESKGGQIIGSFWCPKY